MRDIKELIAECAREDPDVIFGPETEVGKAMDILGKAAKVMNPGKRMGTVLADGQEYYVVVMHPKTFHDIKCMAAREAWNDYYRSVRILRRMRRSDPEAFNRMSRAWYKAGLEEEVVARIEQREQVRRIIAAEARRINLTKEK